MLCLLLFYGLGVLVYLSVFVVGVVVFSVLLLVVIFSMLVYVRVESLALSVLLVVICIFCLLISFRFYGLV